MRSDQLVAVLDRLDAAGARVWLAGGWGVDALVGTQTRPHGDLDLAVDSATLSALMAALGDDGFVVTVDWAPSRFEMTASDGRVVDIHPVVFADDGSGEQAGIDGETFLDAANGFTTGEVDGRVVPVLSARQQLRFRHGYELRGVDLHDIPLLQQLR